MSEVKPDLVIEASDDTCATLPQLMKRSMAPLESGAVLEVLSHDPAARDGVPAWCRLTGHTLEAAIDVDANTTRFLVRKR
jgi:tRNA 2-thiouridine synthesizing protein A